MNELLEKIKLALRIKTTAFDAELTDLVYQCVSDMGFAGIDTDIIGAEYLSDPAVVMAIITFCKFSFGKLDSNEYDRLKASYDEQKKQLGMATGYTDWGVSNG
jgi:hypothetical protein